MSEPTVPLRATRRRGRRDDDRTLSRIGLWGATSSGKTTMLASLHTALSESDGDGRDWVLFSGNPTTTTFLARARARAQLTRGEFPAPTAYEAKELSLRLLRARPAGVLRRLARRPARRIEFELTLMDVSGRMYDPSVFGVDPDRPRPRICSRARRRPGTPSRNSSTTWPAPTAWSTCSTPSGNSATATRTTIWRRCSNGCCNGPTISVGCPTGNCRTISRCASPSSMTAASSTAPTTAASSPPATTRRCFPSSPARMPPTSSSICVPGRPWDATPAAGRRCAAASNGISIPAGSAISPVRRSVSMSVAAGCSASRISTMSNRSVISRGYVATYEAYAELME